MQSSRDVAPEFSPSLALVMICKCAKPLETDNAKVLRNEDTIKDV
jgi:hypothetical protein